MWAGGSSTVCHLLAAAVGGFCTFAALDFKLKYSGTGIGEQAQESAKMEGKYIMVYCLLSVHGLFVSDKLQRLETAAISGP